MGLRDIFIRLGIQVDGAKKLDDTDKALTKTLTKAKSFGARLQSLGKLFLGGVLVNGIKNFIQDQITQADALKHSAESIGITTDELQKFQYVARLMQIPVQQITVAMRYFNRAVGEASFGGKAAATAFGRLGMKIRDGQGNIRPTDELLFEFADKLHAIPNEAQRTALAMRTLGRGGTAMLPALQEGSAALREMFADIEELGGGFDEDFINKAHEVVRQQQRLNMGWRTMVAAIGKVLLPVMAQWLQRSIKTVKNLIDFAHHTYFVRTALLALASATVIFALKKLFDLFAPAKTTVAEFMLSLLNNLPLVILAGLALIAYLAFDELFTGLKGGKTIIGDFLDSIGGAGTGKKFFDDLREALKGVSDALGPLADNFMKAGAAFIISFVDNMPGFIRFNIKLFGGLAQLIGTVITGVQTLGALTKGAWMGLGNLMLGDTKNAGKAIDEAGDKAFALNAAWEKTMKTVKAVMDVADKIPDLNTPRLTPQALADSKDKAAAAEVAGIGRLDQAPAARPIVVNANTNITVNTNGDPKAAGDAVRKGVHQGIKDAHSRNRDTHAAVNMGQPQTGT